MEPEEIDACIVRKKNFKLHSPPCYFVSVSFVYILSSLSLLSFILSQTRMKLKKILEKNYTTLSNYVELK